MPSEETGDAPKGRQGHGCVRGLLFDKDGTLFDFAATWAVVTDSLLDALAPPGRRDEMARAVGYDPLTRSFVPGSPIVAGTVEDCAEIWSRFRPDLGPDGIAETAEALTAEAVAGGALVPALPDLAGFLAALRRQGYLLGVATNDSEAAARQQLGAAGVLTAFDLVIGADSGHGAKPGEGMLLAFARAGGLAPGQVAVIGDSLHDMAMAGSAGLRVAVLTGPAGRDVLAPAADAVLDSIAALPDFLAGWGAWRKGDTA